VPLTDTGGRSMLILTRRVTEQIRIGEEITVAILGIKGNSVRIGVEAPKYIVVDREEVAERRLQEPRQDSSTRSGPGDRECGR
jgi:carbon storage regulator